jgi:hypothetical protein
VSAGAAMPGHVWRCLRGSTIWVAYTHCSSAQVPACMDAPRTFGWGTSTPTLVTALADSDTYRERSSHYVCFMVLHMAAAVAAMCWPSCVGNWQCPYGPGDWAMWLWALLARVCTLEGVPAGCTHYYYAVGLFVCQVPLDQAVPQ